MFRVLLPLDESVDRARRQASFVDSVPCAGEDVSVIVCHAVDPADSEDPGGTLQVDSISSVEVATTILEDAGISYSVTRLNAPAAQSIIDLAEREDVAVIVMGGRKRTPAEKAILGSVTQTVILDADVPVVVTGGE